MYVLDLCGAVVCMSLICVAFLFRLIMMVLSGSRGGSMRFLPGYFDVCRRQLVPNFLFVSSWDLEDDPSVVLRSRQQTVTRS